MRQIRPILVTLGLLVPFALTGCDSEPPTTSSNDAVTTPPEVKRPRTSDRETESAHAMASDQGRRAPEFSAAQSPAAARKSLKAARDLMSQTMAYMDANRFDLAEKNFQTLQARRDSLPEFLQVQVDRMGVLLKTGAAAEPQRSLKAAIMESQESRKD